MTESRSFDHAAGVYDRTRPFPMEARGIQAIVDVAGTKARMLEVGTGTGRVSIPLLHRGANVVGVDLSHKMLTRFREKFSTARLTQTDAGRLPFRTNAFDAILTVHVMHLIAPWREALREFQRVLAPGGVYLDVRTYETVTVSVREAMRKSWRRWLAARGIDGGHPGVGREALRQELQLMGASVTEVEVVRFTHRYTLREELERFETRIYSDTWNVPDAVFEESVHEMRAQALRDHGDLDRPFEDETRFALDVVRFQS